MKALFIPWPAKKIGLVIAILILATPWIYPEVVLASSLQVNGQNNVQTFQIKNPSLIQNLNQDSEKQNSLTIDAIQQADPLNTDLQAYLQSYNSPLQGYTTQLLQHDNWKTVVAISFV